MAIIATAIIIVTTAGWDVVSCKESRAHRGRKRLAHRARDGTLLGLFVSRANENRTEKEE